MAKSIIQVEVNSGAFDSFQARFNKYKTDLKSQPATWGSIGKAMTMATNPLVKMAAAASVFNTRLREAPTAMGKFKVVAQSAVTTVDRLALGTLKIARNVANTTGSLLKWLGITSALSGLLGGAGLFGLGRLASSAFEQRRQAKGTGSSIGEQRAFDVNFGKYVDSQSFLSNITDVMQDQSKRYALYAAGLTDEQMRGKSPAEVGEMYLTNARQKFMRGDRSVQSAQALGLTEVMGMQDLNRLANTSDEEFNASRGRYKQDREQLGVSDNTARAWQDFSIQLSRAGQQIETVFIKGLTPLLPGLTKLSDALARALGSALANPKIGEWLDGFGTGLENAAKYLTSDDFTKSLKRFVEGVSVLGEKLYWLMSKLGWVKGDTSTPSAIAPPAAAARAGTPDPRASLTVGQAIKADLHRMFGFGGGDVSDTINAGLKEGQKQPQSVGTGPTLAEKQAFYAKFSALESQRNLPPGMLRAVYKQESSEGQRMGPSRAGALGPFQFMPQTAKEYGLDDPMDTEKSADAASRKFANLMKYYKGDTRKALAAYNFGEGNLNKAIQKATKAERPADWLDYTPKETQGYVNNITKTMGQSNGGAVRIDIYNNTGGSAIVSTNQLAR